MMINQPRKTVFLLCAVGLALAGPVAGATSSTSSAAMMSSKTSSAGIAPSAVVGRVQGRSLVHKLRRGGLILWMRHTARDSRSGTVTDRQAAAHNCARQSQLTAKGRAQARAVGAGMQGLNLPIAAVYAARLCRTETTARLLNVAPVHTEPRLDEASTWSDRGGNDAYQKAVRAILSTPPPTGKDVVAVTSKLTIPNPRPAVLAALGPGEVAVFRPQPEGRPQLLARIGRKAWPALARRANASKAPATH